MKHIRSIINILALNDSVETPHRVACILRYLSEASDPFNNPDRVVEGDLASNLDFGRYILLSICAETLDALYAGEVKKLEEELKAGNISSILKEAVS